MSMPRNTKAALYGQMAENQLIAATVLAHSKNPRIQSMIWIQLAFLALELSTKAYLVHNNIISSEKDLKNKVGHNFDKFLNNNPDVNLIFEKSEEFLIKDYNQMLTFYKNQKLRYLSLELIILKISTKDKIKFLKLIEELIRANNQQLLIHDLTNILNH